MKNNQIKKNCHFCQKEFMARNWKNSPGKFCSADCQRKGRKRETKMVAFTCQLCSKEFSQPKWWKSPGKYCSIKCMSKVRGENMREQNHPRWTGGSKRNGNEKRAIKHAKLLNSSCKKCGSKENLHGHHVIKHSERPDLCDVLENIEILCCHCHAKEHPELNFIARPIVKKGLNKNCEICSKQYYIPRCREKTSTCCSRRCSLKKASNLRFKKEVCISNET